MRRPLDPFLDPDFFYPEQISRFKMIEPPEGLAETLFSILSKFSGFFFVFLE